MMQGTGCMDLFPQLFIHYSSIFKPGLTRQHPSHGAERFPKYLGAVILLAIFAKILFDLNFTLVKNKDKVNCKRVQQITM